MELGKGNGAWEGGVKLLDGWKNWLSLEIFLGN